MLVSNAQHFGGNLQLISVDGFGTDAGIYVSTTSSAVTNPFLIIIVPLNHWHDIKFQDCNYAVK
jgi:hypothetical protein